MNYKINCQIIDILLNNNNEFTNKYTSVSSGSFEFDTLLEDYYLNKNMRNIKIDRNNQSLCFTNQKNSITLFNNDIKKNDEFFEEIHIHCNDLDCFDNLVEYLYDSSVKNEIDEVDVIPHYEVINNNNFKDYELVIQPMTNEVSDTKSLVNFLAKKNDETIFRAIAIHFCKLVNNSYEINSDLIHKLNDIFKDNVVDNENIFFSDELSNKFLNIMNEEKSYESKVINIPSQKIEINDEYIVDNYHDKHELEK